LNVLATELVKKPAEISGIAGHVDAAVGDGREFALYWRGTRTARWFAQGGKSTGRRFVAQSFCGREGSGLWRGWPASQSLGEMSPPAGQGSGGAFVAGTFEDDRPEADWSMRVRGVLKDIHEDRLEKLILYRTRSAPVLSGSVGAALAQIGPPLERETVFLWHRPGQGTFLARTPEMLIEDGGDSIRVDALAGTALHANTLTRSEKDLREHACVCRDIHCVLAPLTRELTQTAVGAVRFAHVFHLYSRFAGRLLPSVGISNLVGALHPTPAVGALPREALKQALSRHEAGDRGYYAAPIGVWDPDAKGPARRGSVAVALRCALVRDARVTVFGGAGIVRGSDPQGEWRETAEKMRPLEKAWSGA